MSRIKSCGEAWPSVPAGMAPGDDEGKKNTHTHTKLNWQNEVPQNGRINGRKTYYPEYLNYNNFVCLLSSSFEFVNRVIKKC